MIRLVDVYTRPEALQFLYELLRQRSEEDDPYVNISHRQLPTVDQHQAFFTSKPYRHWWMIEHFTSKKHGWDPAGTILLTKRNEIGIVLLRDYRRMGIGRAAVQWVLGNNQPLPGVASERLGSFVAHINPANTASIRLFTGAGGKHISNTYELNSEERT